MLNRCSPEERKDPLSLNGYRAFSVASLVWWDQLDAKQLLDNYVN